MHKQLLIIITCIVSVFAEPLCRAQYNDPYVFSPYKTQNQFKVPSIPEEFSNNIRFEAITPDPWDPWQHPQSTNPVDYTPFANAFKSVAYAVGKAGKEFVSAPVTFTVGIAKTIEYIGDIFEADNAIRPVAFHQPTIAHEDYTKSLVPITAIEQKEETSYNHSAFTMYQTELSKYLTEIDIQSFPAVHKRTQKRLYAFKAYEQNQTCYKETYALKEEITPYMRRHSLDMEAYEICHGTVIQHQLHQEILEILTTNCEIERIFTEHQETTLFGDLVVEGADLAREMNKQGKMIDGFRIADYCGWLNEAEYPRLASFIKQAAGIVVGTVEGGANIVKNTYQMFRHPVDTVEGLACILGQTSIFLFHGVQEVGPFAFHLSFHGTPAGYEIHPHFAKDLNAIKNFYNQTAQELAQLPPEERARKIMAFFTELYFTGKFMGQVAKIKRAATANIIKPSATALVDTLQLYKYKAITQTYTRIASTVSNTQDMVNTTIKSLFKAPDYSYEFVMDGAGNWRWVCDINPASLENITAECTSLVNLEKTHSIISKTSFTEIIQSTIQENTTNLLPGASQYALIAATPSYIPLSAEIDYLRSLFDKTREDWRNQERSDNSIEKRYLKIKYGHILDADPNNKLSGLHHDYLGYYENNGILQLEEKVIGKFGEYGGKSKWNGIRTKAKIKTLFPQHWTRKEVIENILEAYDNFLASKIEPILEKSGKYRINSPTKSGMIIEMFIDQNCNLLSAYPII